MGEGGDLQHLQNIKHPRLPAAASGPPFSPSSLVQPLTYTHRHALPVRALPWPSVFTEREPRTTQRVPCATHGHTVCPQPATWWQRQKMHKHNKHEIHGAFWFLCFFFVLVLRTKMKTRITGTRKGRGCCVLPALGFSIRRTMLGLGTMR